MTVIRTIGLTLLFVPLLSYGHGDALGFTEKSITEVFKNFKSVETGATIRLFNGIKAFPDPEKERVARAKVYLKNSPELTYTCREEHGHDGKDIVECNKD